MAVKETRKLAKEEPSDIASEVLDDGYIDVMDDKTVALFPLGRHDYSHRHRLQTR